MEFPSFQALSLLIMLSGMLWICTQKGDVEKSISYRFRQGDHCWKMIVWPFTAHGLEVIIFSLSTSLQKMHAILLRSMYEICTRCSRFQAFKRMDFIARKFRVLSAMILPIRVSSLNVLSWLVLMERSKSSSSMSREG